MDYKYIERIENELLSRACVIALSYSLNDNMRLHYEGTIDQYKIHITIDIKDVRSGDNDN